MMNKMNLLTRGEFSNLYDQLRSEDGLMAVLAQMQENSGIHERKAYENADYVIRLVAAHENAVKIMSDESTQMLNEFLAQAAMFNAPERKVRLHQLYFGLKLYQDETLVERMKEGATESALFNEYFAECGNDPAITELMLEAEIRKLMDNYRMSPQAMRYIFRKMAKSQDLCATAATLGEQGMRFKAVVAMDLYLRNQDTMTLEQAVNISCSNVDLQAAADSVSRGLITEERAKNIIFAVAMACVIFAVLALTPIPCVVVTRGTCMVMAECTAMSATAQSVVGTTVASGIAAAGVPSLFLGAGLSFFSDKLAQWIGKLSAKISYFRSTKEASVDDVVEQMIKRMEIAPVETAGGQIAELEDENPQVEAAKLNAT